MYSWFTTWYDFVTVKLLQFVLAHSKFSLFLFLRTFADEIAVQLTEILIFTAQTELDLGLCDVG